ncbi:hypothetical protein RPMA_03545 [Tardiphaga alba]|uniref:Uncharacterized protein n=1 Tax=Tardiphaga alba TaxID=340268 RepID=A0ABX8A382_9BRAD|nr:hypothetical protein [Tardiphaga alba]QUS38034.1 hypothetical protein RPMA_03545 [Tardiphaga alba]
MAPEEKKTTIPSQAGRCREVSETRSYYASIHDRDQLARAILQGGSWADPEIADLTARAASSPTVDGQLLNSFISDDDQADEAACDGCQKVAVDSMPPATRPCNPFGSNAASLAVSENRVRPDGVVDPFMKHRGQARNAEATHAGRVQVNPNPFFPAI